jgi:hypothetical protein
MCEGSCPYFAFCGGGPPGNKYFENGTFASTETLSCRLHKKVCIDSWSERLLLGEVEEVDGHFIPRLGWRAPTGEEQLVLVGDPSLLTKDEVLDRGLCLFGLPRHLQSASWALLGRAQEVASPPRLEGFDGFVREVGKFLDFKGLPVPEGAAFDLVLSKPGQRSVRGSWPLPDAAPWPHLWGGINLGDEALSLLFVNLTARQIQAELVRQFPDRPPPTDLDELARRFLAHCPDYPLVRLSSEPGEGYRAPTDGLLIDACTLGMQGPSVMLLVRHPMPVTLEPRTPRRGNG